MKTDIPSEVTMILTALRKAGFSAYIVGGSVRDLLLNRTPKDWDITTEATPEEIQSLFADSVYENDFGTVGIKTNSEDPRLKIVEVTTFRTESGYSDKRRPDSVSFTTSVEEDLARRDFTVNALAYDPTSDVLVDPYDGKKDIESNIIRTVGDPRERFGEDALRLLRAARFSAELNFALEEKTTAAIAEMHATLAHISAERIRDEFSKLIMSDLAAKGIIRLEKLGLLEHIIPELREGIGMSQNKHHTFTVFQHNVKSLHYAAKKGFSLEIRLSALLHDVGKPRTKRGEGEDATFYGHQVVGARMAKEILSRLRYPKHLIEKVTLLIREHMFVYDIGEVTDAGVRRLVRRTGKENIEDLFRLREADRIGSGVPKAQPYRLRHLKFMVEKVSKDPISVGMLNIDGNDLIKEHGMDPGPKIGLILNALMGEVLEDPEKNTLDYLAKRAEELKTLSENELRPLAAEGKESRDEAQEEVEKDIKKKYWLK